ncbi:Uncharacterised protein [Legionella sainthelensi]|nr:Uncharacterised protein [Legionella sainthelensi]
MLHVNTIHLYLYFIYRSTIIKKLFPWLFHYMEIEMKKRSLIIAATAAALFTSGVYASSSLDNNGANTNSPTNLAKNSCSSKNNCNGKNSCKGANSCKGKNHCKGKNCCKGKNHCKSKNSCKGSNKCNAKNSSNS